MPTTRRPPPAGSVNRTARVPVSGGMTRLLRLALAAAAAVLAVAACSSDDDRPPGQRVGGRAARDQRARRHHERRRHRRARPPAARAPVRAAGGTITIKDFKYGSPLTVAPGAQIEVENEDTAGHDVVSDDGKFKTPVLGQGEKATFTAPTKPGTYKFSCSLHPASMSGHRHAHRAGLSPSAPFAPSGATLAGWPGGARRRVPPARRGPWSTERLLDWLRDPPRDEPHVRQPSLLPGWTRAHVLGPPRPQRRRAWSGRSRAPWRGERLPMYAGEAERAADIEATSRQDARRAGRRGRRPARSGWTSLVGRMTPAAWEADAEYPVRAGAGAPADRGALAGGGDPPGRPGRGVRAGRLAGVVRRPAAAVAAGPGAAGPRLPAGVAVEVADTDSGRRWSAGPQAARRVPVRGPSWALVGWLVGRPSAVRRELGTPPELSPWA